MYKIYLYIRRLFKPSRDSFFYKYIRHEYKHVVNYYIYKRQMSTFSRSTLMMRGNFSYLLTEMVDKLANATVG